MNYSLSSFELSYLVKELQVLQGAKIEKVRCEEFGIAIELYIPTVGKQFLSIQPPDRLFLSAEKIPTVELTGFVKQARQYIQATGISSITQHEYDRIIVIEFTNGNKLIAELFSLGNIIVTDAEHKILTCQQVKRWSEERYIRPGNTYHFPVGKPNPLSYSVSQLKKLLLEEKILGKFFASILGYGHVYASELLHLLNATHETTSQEVTAQQVHEAIGTLAKQPLQAVSYHQHAYPIVLEHLPFAEMTSFQSFNAAIMSIQSQSKEPQQEKPKKSTTIVKKQSQQLEKLEQTSVEAQAQGDFIYGHYQLLEQCMQATDEQLEQLAKEHNLTIKKNKHELIIEQ